MTFPQRVGSLTRIGDHTAPALYLDAATNKTKWFAFEIGQALDKLDEHAINYLFQCLSDKGLEDLRTKIVEAQKSRVAGSIIDQQIHKKN
jgi:hypothetical protein